jgi:hypothetical protein
MKGMRTQTPSPLRGLPSVKSVLAMRRGNSPTRRSSYNDISNDIPISPVSSLGSPITSSSRRFGVVNLYSPNSNESVSPLNTRPTINTKNLKICDGLNSAPVPIAGNHEFVLKPKITYGKWEDRMINPFLPLIASYIPHLMHLSLSGCHINDWDFANMLEQLSFLESLDISFSTVKNEGLEGVSRYCRFKLKWLNVSGIFRFGRNRPVVLAAIVQNCKALKILVVKDCPEIDKDEHISEFRNLSSGRVTFVTCPSVGSPFE